jgi:putative ABC transport system substrate-binding protein
VFTIVPDPIGSGFVRSLSRPGGNATGFLQFEFHLSGKWLELLKQITPGLTRAAILCDGTVPAGAGQWAVIQSVAPSLGVEITPIDVQNAVQIEHDVTAFARSSESGLVVTSSTNGVVFRKSNRCACRSVKAASGLRPTRIRQGRWVDVLFC